MRSIWKGSISFGLVNIPVKLYPATQPSNLKLQIVDKRDYGKIRYKRINERTGKEVSPQNLGKAYQLKSDPFQQNRPNPLPSSESAVREIPERKSLIEAENRNMIILTRTDFEEVAPERSKIIEINHFVEEKEIDAVYFENSYYIEPEKSEEKPYALLRETLLKSGKVGVGRFVLRTAATLAVIKPMNEALLLIRIRFAEEIRSAEGLNFPSKYVIKPNELKMALTLVNQYSDHFDIQKYKDEYVDSLRKKISDRAVGKETKVRKIKESDPNDLKKQLKASLSRNQAS